MGGEGAGTGGGFFISKKWPLKMTNYIAF